MANKKTKVAVALSGGVDSSVAATLLKNNGYDAVGVHLVCYDEDVPYCTARKDREDVVRVANLLDIPLKIYDFRRQYKERVINYFIREYKKNRTPNPDVMCNMEIKFGLLLDSVLKDLKVDYLATGHYARITDDSRLLRGVDPNKDQSYFLYTLTKDKLEHVLFPIGHLLKKDVRKIAKRFNLPTAEKKDSQGICFIGKVDVTEFLKEKIKPNPGPVVSLDRKTIGEHQGLSFYTIGQRHGFNISRFVGKPLYVVGKDVKTNTLIVGSRRVLAVKRFIVSDVHWINEVAKKCEVRIRHLGKLLKCEVESGELEGGAKMWEVRLDDVVWGVAPGQSSVFYKGEEVLGGGIIEDPVTKIDDVR